MPDNQKPDDEAPKPGDGSAKHEDKAPKPNNEASKSGGGDLKPDDLSSLYQEVILDHSRKPRNFRAMPDASCHAEGRNPLCGDHFTVYLKVENGAIKEATFQGDGCAISKASASMMTDYLKGKKIEDARSQFDKYHQMLTTGKVDENALGKLHAFSGVHNFPMRVKCAVLPWHAMMAGLKGEASATTEESKS